MLFLRRMLPALTVLLLLGGCVKPPEPGTPVTWEAVGKGEMREQRVSLEGYFQIPKSMMATDTVLLPLYEKPDGEGMKVPFSTRIGSGNNEIESLPKEFTEADFKVHSSDGSLVSKNQKLRVSGKLIGTKESTILYGPVLIEKI